MSVGWGECRLCCAVLCWGGDGMGMARIPLVLVVASTWGRVGGCIGSSQGGRAQSTGTNCGTIAESWMVCVYLQLVPYQ